MFNHILNNKKIIIGFFIAITLFLAPFAAKVKPDNSVESLGVRGDPALELMHKLENIFGSEEFTSISFETPDILSAATLQMIEQMTEEIEKIPSIDKVMSLTRIPNLQESADGTFTVSKLILPEWIQTGVPASQKSWVLNHKISERLFFNKTGTATTIMAQFKPLGSNDALRDQILSQIDTIIQKYQRQTDTQFHILGMPVVNRLNFGVVEQEQNITNSLLMFIVACSFWVLYRRFSLVVLPLGLLGIVMVWVMGTIGLIGARFNWMLAIAPAVITIVSICNSIHVINAYLELKNYSKADRVKQVVQTIGLPCFFTTLTDLIGFFSISGSRIYAVRDFGIYVGLGSLYAFIATIFLLPIFLTLLKDKPKKPGAARFDALAQKILMGVLAFDLKHPKKVLLGGTIVLVFSIVGISKINVEQRILSTFKWGNHQIKTANDFATKEVGAGAEFYFFFDSKKPDYFLEPAHLKMLEKIEHRVIAENASLLVKAVGLPDLIKTINQAVHQQKPEYYVIPDTKAEVAQLLFLVSTDQSQISSLTNLTYDKTRLRVFSVLSDSANATMNAIKSCKRIMDEETPPEISHDMSGRPRIMCDTMDYILSSQVGSFGSACLVIFISLMLLFRSVPLGLICMIPNVLPILMTLGFMGWVGIDLDVATSMVASTVIGIAVDDTIHFVWGIKKQVRAGHSYESALHDAFKEAGFSAFSATFVVVSGFMVFLASQVWPATYFGLLTALACFLALATELFLTPALLMTFKPIRSA